MRNASVGLVAAKLWALDQALLYDKSLEGGQNGGGGGGNKGKGTKTGSRSNGGPTVRKKKKST